MKPGLTNRHHGIVFPPYRLDVDNACVWRGTKRIPLSATDSALLAYLSSRPGQLVTHDQLFSALWPSLSVTHGLLKVRVRRLRQALGDRAQRPRFIETVHGRGYRFIATVVKNRAPARSQRSTRDAAAAVADIFVGHAADLAILQRHVERAFNGERQVLFVAGEPGIGKTALVRDLLAHAVEPDGAWVGYGQCIESHGTAESYRPVLEALARACRGPNGRRLQRRLRTLAPSWLAQMPALLTTRDAEALRRATIGGTSERMVRELADTLDVVTSERPVVLWLEDIHWSDVSSLTLLSALANRPDAARLFIVATYRPVDALASDHPLLSVVRELEAHRRCRSLTLEPLSPDDVGAYLAARFATNTFPTPLAAALHRRTEGNPLFLVGLVDDLVARGGIAEVAGRWTLRADVDALKDAVPASLRLLVARQRERLSDLEQEMLAAASLVGVMFSAPLVAAALGRPVASVEDSCARLAERQLFLREAAVIRWRDGTMAATYTFLHAVYQALWRERVGPSTRREWHRRIGERLEQAHGEEASEIAAELAMHFESAASDAQALRYLRRAVANAMRRRAPHEAILLARKALDLLGRATNQAERAETERELRFVLGRLELVRQGYASPDVRENYARLHELCREQHDRRLFPTLVSLVRFHLHRAEVDTAHELAAQAFRLAEASPDRWLAGAHTLIGTVQFNLGRLTTAHDHLRAVLSLHQSHPSDNLARLYGENVEVPALAYLAIMQWYVGYPDQALKSSQAALTTARQLGLPAPLALALGFASWLHRLRREPDATHALATELLSTATDHGFPFWTAQATFELGWALAAAGRTAEGRMLMQEGLERYGATGARMHHVGNVIAQIEIARAHGGDDDSALPTVTDLVTTVQRTGQRYHESALHRLRGELLTDVGDDVAANECFQHALEVAVQQNAKLPEMQATMSRARLWQRQRRAEEARALVRRSYGWFTEGFDTPDLRDAREFMRRFDAR